MLVIDPFNKVRDKNASSLDVNRYTMEYLTKDRNTLLKSMTCLYLL